MLLDVGVGQGGGLDLTLQCGSVAVILHSLHTSDMRWRAGQWPGMC